MALSLNRGGAEKAKAAKKGVGSGRTLVRPKGKNETVPVAAKTGKGG